MFVMRFTERAYVAYSAEDVKNSFRSAVRLTFSNSHFNPALGADLYNEYLDEYEYSDEIGFDGLMLNEHHNTPTCMGAAMNLEAAILARTTKRAKIILLGNPLPIFDNPVRLAEELAEIDMISRGRLVSGFVRGTGIESWATNTNPAHNRERFDEAHDLVIKTWTTPGPFRWEGKHYQFRVVNPFERPLQKPHPPVWIPGVGSPETIVWCARHHYPYIYLETDPQVTLDLMSIYAKAAREVGYEPGPQNFGYLVRIHVQDTDEKAYEVGEGFLVGNAGVGRVPLPGDFMAPPGYNSREATKRLLEQYRHSLRPDPLYGGVDAAGWEKVVETNRVIVGNPDTVIKKVRHMLSALRPGILGVWTNDGTISHKDTMRCLQLMEKEVLPALKEMGKELDLPGPFEQAP
ncbi:MAG TPA: LLM class flavin-dependent oxidoreductase [Candidatus Binatia bacterium]|jgi:alkanesulfonate monooxygenase SsuD/methylene tetrahydromethanopterin reductase-like flavin-dependent oxidoreductase (luciferase family)|nr:LLM class flavin-dependent oxidoreductase [Candidatus Binatia bacterium]